MEETVKEVMDFSDGFIQYISTENVISVILKIIACIAVICIFSIIIKILNKVVKKFIYAHNKFSERKAKTLNTVCSSIIRYTFYFFAICQILTIFGVDVTSFVAVAGIGSVAIAFGAQSLVQDIVTGMFILIEDQFAVGDVISIEGYSGTVEGIGIRSTKLRSVDGNLFIIPNGQIKVVTNMSKGFNRAVVDISVAYEENIDNVIAVMKDELKSAFENKKINGLIKEPDVLGVVDLGDSAVVIRVSADSVIGENWAIERELRRIIKNRFDKENICIPYPQIVLHKGNTLNNCENDRAEECKNVEKGA